MRYLLPCALFCAGCATDATASPPLTGELDLEIRDTAAVTMDGATVQITPSAGHGLLSAGVTLTASIRVDRLPEASATLYTARFERPAQPKGPCADKPISLALSLHRQGDNAMVVGGLTAYCGADTWYGVPARVLRLAGALR